MALNRRCVACGQCFDVRPQVPDQRYCPSPPCQRERRKLWQQSRRRTDPDYRDNQLRAQAAWLARNPDYWKCYRESHPDYVQRNRQQQRRKAQQQGSMASDVAAAGLFMMYVISPIALAKMDACLLVKLVPVSGLTRP
ncbi:hypothetical protein [Pelomonas sp. KK5]|uniref:hypothetical protein n=1 Tax=Pelomonas sp. KK5 TaxID=1855730 RepID=UPI00097BD0A0|nr:hypothetical protein [Pelomonas sp. KK5]